tara:strand:- start:463 stop:1125 length:663 start_codon:yes stop_codon:yes gene_type:complete
MVEINLMKSYPKTENRKQISENRKKASTEDIRIARQFGKEYFDGDRSQGLGGYYYDEKYFTPVVKDFIEHYNLDNSSSILDVGCGKGFMLHDFKVALPEAKIAGIDISKYCIDNTMSSVSEFCITGSCDNLPYPDNSFDLVIAIATIHNLELEGVKKSLKEIQRVTKKSAFIKVNGYKNEIEKKALFDWNLVAKTILHVDDWKKIFQETNYEGDYFWFTP